MKSCHPSQIADEVERHGGSIAAGYCELKLGLPADLATPAWLHLITKSKAGLIAYLTPRVIDREDFEAHMRWSAKTSEGPALKFEEVKVRR